MSSDVSQVSTSWEVDTRQVKRRRRWPEGVKRAIVAETRASGASVSVVARRHDLNANQLFAWCRRYGDDASGLEMEPSGLLPVTLAAAPGGPAPRHAIDHQQPGAGLIEIGFAGGIVVRISGAAEATTLRQVLTVLAQR